jgi:hypothetical protein
MMTGLQKKKAQVQQDVEKKAMKAKLDRVSVFSVEAGEGSTP